MSFDFSSFDTQVEETADWLREELNKIRSGRVSGAILNDISVSAYGSKTPLEQLAGITNEGPRTLRVNVYDASQIDAAEKALRKADLGASIAKDESGLRLNFPEMTEENRKKAIQRAKSKREEARVSLRKVRQEVAQEIESAEESGDISEDQKYRLKEKLDEKMQSAKSKLDELVEEKKQDLQA